MNTNLNLLLQESLEEEKRCIDNKDYEGFSRTYNESKRLLDEIAMMNCLSKFKVLTMISRSDTI